MTRYPVAIKIISKKMILSQSSHSDVALNEVKILRAVDHPSVIRMEDVVETDTHLYIILELAVGGELFDKIIQVSAAGSNIARARTTEGHS
jgi:serine/threonine protein kinase